MQVRVRVVRVRVQRRRRHAGGDGDAVVVVDGGYNDKEGRRIISKALQNATTSVSRRASRSVPALPCRRHYYDGIR